MIPSLVAGELRTSIVEYLATTFALSDDETYRALTDFLLDSDDGIFRGPYLRVRLPYPMNALVTDQERRIAAMLTDPAAAATGVRAGVWIGDDQSTSTRRDMTATHLISDPAALMDDPPDILLTNYKMLDRLLTTPRRQRLWAANTPPKPRTG